MEKRATSLFNSFCSNVAKEVEGFCCPFYRTFKDLTLPGTNNNGSHEKGGSRGGSRGRVQGVRPEMTCGFLIQLVFCKKRTMWFIGVEVEQETSAPPPKKNPGSAPGEEPEKAPIFSHVFVFWYVSSRKAGALRDETSRA